MESFKKHKNTISSSNEERKNQPYSIRINFNDIEGKNIFNSEKLKTNNFGEIQNQKDLINFSDCKMDYAEEDKLEDIKKDNKLSEGLIKNSEIENNSYKNYYNIVDSKDKHKDENISNIQINLQNKDISISNNYKDDIKNYIKPNHNMNLSMRSNENLGLIKPIFNISGELGINNNFYYTNQPKKINNPLKLDNLSDSIANNSKYKSPLKNKEISYCSNFRSQISLSKESKKSGRKRKSEKMKSQNEYKQDLEYIELSKKCEEEVKYTNEKFKTSRRRLFEILKDKKKFLIGAGISAGLNGAVWPMYGVLLAQAIGTLSQKDIELVHSGGIKIALYFFTLAVCASIVLWMQK
jgi:hypothetical protein